MLPPSDSAGRPQGSSGWFFWGILCTALAVAGPFVVTRLWLEKFAFCGLLATAAWLAYLAQKGTGLGTLLAQSGRAGMPFWRAVDLVFALPVAWFPLAADYNRFAESGRRALWGTAFGTVAGTVACLGLGGLLLISGGVLGDPLGRVLFLAGTGVTLLLILVGETDQIFAQVYSSALATQNLFPRLRQRWMAAGLGIVCTGLAVTTPVTRYEAYLAIMGSVFVPLTSVVLADYFCVARRGYDVEELFRRHGRYWFAGGFRWQGFVAWGLGIATYGAMFQWAPTLSASLPAIAAAFGAYVLLTIGARGAIERGGERGLT